MEMMSEEDKLITNPVPHSCNRVEIAYNQEYQKM